MPAIMSMLNTRDIRPIHWTHSDISQVISKNLGAILFRGTAQRLSPQAGFRVLEDSVLFPISNRRFTT